ncbi:MAG TPA: ABC transporter ATP-binding protein [Steroidobacteraceae bacterium]|nr:ABC transporter ATP-binding protein [Steroidobacteraceae bacterium]
MKPAPVEAHGRWRLLARIAFPFRWQFVWVAVLSLLATSTDLLSPIIYREAVNDIAGLFVGAPGETGIDELRSEAEGDGEDYVAPKRQAHERGKVAPRSPEQALRTLLWAVALLFAINVVSHWFSLRADQRTVELASRIEAGVIQKTFRHVLALPLAFFNKRASGGIAKQIDQSDQVAPLVSAAAHDVAPELMRMLGVLIIMFTQSWKLTLIALVLLPPYLWVVLRSSRRLETGLETYYEMWDAVSARIQDALGAIKTVKLSGAESREVARLAVSSDAAYRTYTERNRLANFYLFWQNSLSYLTQALVLGYGGWLVFEHQLTPGDVVMFVVYLDKLYSPIESLTGLTVQLQEHLAALTRAAKLLEAETETAGGAALPPGPGRVDFENVTFGYLPGRDVLRGVSFTLAPGRTTALVGPSGAGKTTTADLLLRLFEPGAGCIRLDGAVLGSLAPAAVRAEVGVVAADGAIFRATLADNVRYMRPQASDAEVLAAMQAAGLSALLDRLADGLSTEIGERGVGLSVGERQRLQIARALVARPRVLILDEATANLDFATEREIRSALLESEDHATTLVIAHRYSMVECADHVVLLEAGRVIDQGTPAELVERNEWFAAFAESGGGAGADEEEEDEEEEEENEEEDEEQR